MKSQGFPLAVRALVIDRASGLCEVCGQARPGLSVHHRRPRQAGGSRREDTNLPSNALFVCGFGGCHDEIESRREWAYSLGYLLRQNQSPCAVPILRRGEWCLLDDLGGFRAVEGAA